MIPDGPDDTALLGVDTGSVGVGRGMARTGPDRRARLVVWVLWMGAATLTVVMARHAYRVAVDGPIGSDFTIYVRGSRDVLAGRDLYRSGLYVYSPMVALLLTPVAHLSLDTLWRPWTACSLATYVASAAVFVATVWHRLRSWQRPAVFAFCVGTVLHFWPLTRELQLGQADGYVVLVLMLAAAAGQWRLPATSGALVGVAGLLKTWPGAIGVWFFRRGAVDRVRSLVGLVITLLLAPVLALAVGGWSGLSGFVRTSISSRNQRLINDSVTGIPHILFTRSGMARPADVSPGLLILSTVVLSAWVLVLVVLALRSTGVDPLLTFWNLTLCLVMVIPLSHRIYELYVIGFLWVWAVQLLTARRFTWREGVIGAVMLTWWLVVGWAWPHSGSPPTISAWRFSAVFIADLLAATVSVVGARILSRREPG